MHNVKSNILALIVEYCQYHTDATKSTDGKKPQTEEEMKAWDTQFVNVEQAVLFELILAANYLNIKALLDLTCLTVAEMIKGKTPEEIRKTFNIKVRTRMYPPSMRDSAEAHRLRVCSLALLADLCVRACVSEKGGCGRRTDTKMTVRPGCLLSRLSQRTLLKMTAHMPSQLPALAMMQNDFTPEEEEEVKRENLWAFE